MPQFFMRAQIILNLHNLQLKRWCILNYLLLFQSIRQLICSAKIDTLPFLHEGVLQ